MDGWKVFNASGTHRVIVTKVMPGTKWLDLLVAHDCRVEVCQGTSVLSSEELKAAIGSKCFAVLGQLTEKWNDEMFAFLKQAGGKIYSQMAVGFDNVDVKAATRHGIFVGNTPGVLTETTAEMAVALTFSAARRVVEADGFMRGGKYKGWLPNMFIGNRLNRGTVGIIGAGRIGSAFARMLCEGHKMNIVYYDPYPNSGLEKFVAGYSAFLQSQGEDGVTCTRVETVDEVARVADVLSLHTVYNASTRHLIDAKRLSLMKPMSILVNTSRGPVVDEKALVAHCKANPEFRAGLDVFEREPLMEPGLADLPNVTIVPHIASATFWTRSGMASLAACNIIGVLKSYPLHYDPLIFVDSAITDIPQATPSIVNGQDLGMTKLTPRSRV